MWIHSACGAPVEFVAAPGARPGMPGHRGYRCSAQCAKGGATIETGHPSEDRRNFREVADA
jgi:hypothetical protein